MKSENRNFSTLAEKLNHEIETAANSDVPELDLRYDRKLSVACLSLIAKSEKADADPTNPGAISAALDAVAEIHRIVRATAESVDETNACSGIFSVIADFGLHAKETKRAQVRAAVRGQTLGLTDYRRDQAIAQAKSVGGVR